MATNVKIQREKKSLLARPYGQPKEPKQKIHILPSAILREWLNLEASYVGLPLDGAVLTLLMRAREQGVTLNGLNNAN